MNDEKQPISIGEALTNEIQNSPDGRRGCRVCDEIPEDATEQVGLALEVGAITMKGARRVFNAAGYDVSDTTVRRHFVEKH